MWIWDARYQLSGLDSSAHYLFYAQHTPVVSHTLDLWCHTSRITRWHLCRLRIHQFFLVDVVTIHYDVAGLLASPNVLTFYTVWDEKIPDVHVSRLLTTWCLSIRFQQHRALIVLMQNFAHELFVVIIVWFLTPCAMEWQCCLYNYVVKQVWVAFIQISPAFSLVLKRWSAAAVAATPCMSSGVSLRTWLIYSSQCPWWILWAWKSPISCRCSHVSCPVAWLTHQPFHFFLGASMILSTWLGSLLWDIFKSSTCQTMVHWCPSIILLVIHQSHIWVDFETFFLKKTRQQFLFQIRWRPWESHKV